MDSTDPPKDPSYVAARAVLLDALEALAPFRHALVLVGAQAVYLRTGPSDLPVPPHTTDADVAINPRSLTPDTASISAALQAAGFAQRQTANPGQWHKPGDGDLAIDFMVPEMLAGPGGRRGIRIPNQDRRLARRTSGLEATVIDNDSLSIHALDGGDRRSVTVAVAGPLALLLAKAVKLHDRSGTPRVLGKDVVDIFRLLRNASGDDLRARLERALADEELRPDIEKHAHTFVSLFSPRGQGRTLLLKEAKNMGLSGDIVTEYLKLGTDAISGGVKDR